ncbi:GHKL domain-containing protein [Clostridium sp. 19966]|uniref:sensor histidine kinase n=1 Tax=Clostridium sp. 19966 TaxID=2768166 RepID=UPI0028DD71A6|nr:GHKL domain-containing protein [Clostridium sp. 19966]MDT8717299.1 GHKL domain-containing protein [Clostridium sp. 19966]
MLIINMYMISANADSIKKIIYFLTALMNFFILINIITENLMIMNLSKTMKDKEDQYLKLKEYTEVIESMSSDIKKFKHDYTNILKTLDYYIENDDFEALKKYYHKELFPESSKIVKKDSNILYLKNIKNLSLKGILFSKISEAKNENIEIMLDVREEIGEFKINIIDLCRIVGILMDNAIEGTRELDSKKIQIGIIEMDDEKIIVIENSCQLELPPIYKMFEEGFSTKGSERGMGLSIVKGIADKYDNVFINTEVDGNIFRQEIVVSDKIR